MKTTCTALVVISILLLFQCEESIAQTYNVNISNRQLTSPKTFEFDVYINSNGSTGNWALRLFQSAYKFSTGFINGGSLSGFYISGSSQLESTFGKTWSFSYNATKAILNQSSNIGSVCPGALIGTIPRKVGRFKVTNTLNFGCSDDSISFILIPNSTLYLSVGKYNSTDCSDPGTALINSGVSPVVERPNSSLLVARAEIASSVHPCETSATVSVSATGGALPYAGTGNFQMGRGNWTFPVSDARGCLSSANVSIEAIPFTTSFRDTGCGSYFLPWGNVVIESGLYTHNYISALGCDSIVTANILIGQSNSSIEQLTIRYDQLPFSWNGLTLSEAGIYSATLHNVSGCDSVVTLELLNADTCSPRSIFSNALNDSICVGSSATLTVQGNLSPGAVWKWYRGGCGAGSAIGTGSSLKVSPDLTRSYYVRQQGGGCGTTSCASITIFVNTKPTAPVTISGMNTGLCNSSSDFSIAPVMNATNYVWSVPDNLNIQSGQGSRLINVAFGNTLSAGNNICVKANNDCGSSAQRCITVSLKPAVNGGISGPSIMSTGQLGSFGAWAFGSTAYLWNVPGGWTITGGQGSELVSIMAGTTNGYIKVTPSNTCGSGPTANKTVTLSTTLARSTIDINNKLIVWPIPAKDKLFINPGNFMPDYLEVIDLYGRILIRSPFQNSINLNDFSSGVYLLRVFSNDRTSQKLIQISR